MKRFEVWTVAVLVLVATLVVVGSRQFRAAVGIQGAPPAMMVDTTISESSSVPQERENRCMQQKLTESYDCSVKRDQGWKNECDPAYSQCLDDKRHNKLPFADRWCEDARTACVNKHIDAQKRCEESVEERYQACLLDDSSDLDKRTSSAPSAVQYFCSTKKYDADDVCREKQKKEADACKAQEKACEEQQARSDVPEYSRCRTARTVCDANTQKNLAQCFRKSEDQYVTCMNSGGASATSSAAASKASSSSAAEPPAPTYTCGKGDNAEPYFGQCGGTCRPIKSFDGRVIEETKCQVINIGIGSGKGCGCVRVSDIQQPTPPPAQTSNECLEQAKQKWAACSAEYDRRVPACAAKFEICMDAAKRGERPFNCTDESAQCRQKLLDDMRACQQQGEDERVACINAMMDGIHSAASRSASVAASKSAASVRSAAPPPPSTPPGSERNPFRCGLEIYRCLVINQQCVSDAYNIAIAICDNKDQFSTLQPWQKERSAAYKECVRSETEKTYNNRQCRQTLEQCLYERKRDFCPK